MKKSILSLFRLLPAISTHPKTITIHIAEAGTLSHKIASRRKYQIESLKIIGNINQKDILYICDMADCGSCKKNNRNLSVLDLSEAIFSPAIPNNNSQPNTIPAYSFCNCKKLNTIIIPASTVNIEKNAFYKCTKLAAIIVPKENNYYADINGVLFNKNKDSLLFYPKGKTGGYIIPNNITTLNASIFQDCIQLTSIVIPDSVTTIQEEAFSGCYHLKEIFCLSSKPAQCSSTSCFDGVNRSSCTLYIPKGSYSNYWLVQPWGDFVNIKEKNTV